MIYPQNPVKSSNIKSVGKDGDDLIVHFHTGRRPWRYAGAAHHFEPMLGAESVGKYFHANVKGKHKGEPLGE